MKKIILSLIVIFAASVSAPAFAQDGKSDSCCPKTECSKPCKKDAKDCSKKDKCKKDKCDKSKDCPKAKTTKSKK